MAKKLQAPRGTKDILPSEVSTWQHVEQVCRSILSLYNYQEIRTPTFEHKDLFQRSLGQASDIVQKQMFSIEHGDDVFVLRPEATASIARAYVEHHLDFGVKVQKLFYLGSMFRAERPQRGRLREFHHIGVEVIGSESPFVDIELIQLAHHMLQALGIQSYTVALNTLGCKKDKSALQKMLAHDLAKYRQELCKDCQVRIDRNVLRVLDCKEEVCRSIVRKLSIGHEHVCADCKEAFSIVLDGAKSLGIPVVVDPFLVRGLDYYSGCVFEIKHTGLGAQDALGAGGRYDSLFEDLCGKSIGAAGFAFGQERLILVSPKDEQLSALMVYIIPMLDRTQQHIFALAKEIREAGLSCEVDFSSRSLKSRLKEANKRDAVFALLIGEDEVATKTVTVRNMAASSQQRIPLNNIISFLQGSIRT